MLGASGDTRQAAWVPRASQGRTGFRVCCPVIHWATCALPWVPSSSVLEPHLGQRRGVMHVRRRARGQLPCPFPTRDLSGHGQDCCSDSQGSSVHTFHLPLGTQLGVSPGQLGPPGQEGLPLDWLEWQALSSALLSSALLSSARHCSSVPALPSLGWPTGAF